MHATHAVESMRATEATDAMGLLATAGRMFYGIGILAFGLLHIGYGDFVTRVVPWWPVGIPGRPLWAYVIGALLTAAGVALVLNWRTATVSTLLAAGLMLSFVCFGIPLVASDALLGGSWTVAGKILALCGGALLLSESRLAWLGPGFLAAFLILCGIQHFLYIDFVVSLFPTWIPAARFWTYFAGIALIAGGLGLALPATARFAGLLTGLMIFSWVFLIHIPLVFRTYPKITNDLTAVFEALAMSGIALLASRPPQPRKR
jgi:uncharacterized membrane protein